MGTVIKIGLVSAAIGLAIWLVDTAKKAAGAFSYSIARYGSPSLNSAYLNVPITVRFNNPTPIPINIDNLHADIFIQKLGQWTKAGVVDQPISVPAGTSEQTLNTRLDVSQLLNSISSIINLINATLTSKTIAVRTDLTVNYGGIVLPTQSFTKEISIA